MNLIIYYLNIICYIIPIVVIFSLVSKAYRFRTARRNNGYSIKKINTTDCLRIKSGQCNLRQFFSRPMLNFHRKTNRFWAFGYFLYHIAIVTMACGYMLSTIILITKHVQNIPFPVLFESSNCSQFCPTNIAGLIFGNGEIMISEFLFGKYASLFRTITWIDISIACTGNLLLMITLILKKMGYYSGKVDLASKNFKLKGKRNIEQAIVRSIIFCIIWSEILSRLHFMDNYLLVLHIALGLCLILLLPFFYLKHIIFLPFIISSNAEKRQLCIIA